MPDITVKHKAPVVNEFDFGFFFVKRGTKRISTTRPLIITCKSYVRLSRAAYLKLNCPEYFKVGVDPTNNAICVTPALKNETGAMKVTAKQIEKDTIYITKSRKVIDRLIALGMPKEVDGKLVDGDLLFKF